MTFLGRLSGASDVVLNEIERTRKEFVRDYRQAAEITARALAEMKDVAGGYAEEIRCNQTRRYRLFQLAGTKRLALEELVAIAFAHPVGKAAVVAALRVILGALGYDIKPRDEQPKDAMSVVGALVNQLGSVCAEGGKAMGDGNVNDAELAQLAARLPEVEAVIARVRAANDRVNGVAL